MSLDLPHFYDAGPAGPAKVMYHFLCQEKEMGYTMQSFQI